MLDHRIAEHQRDNMTLRSHLSWKVGGQHPRQCNFVNRADDQVGAVILGSAHTCLPGRCTRVGNKLVVYWRTELFRFALFNGVYAKFWELTVAWKVTNYLSRAEC
jgi:hypothetical protein